LGADVCDFDELKGGHRREGLFGAVFWWVVKLEMALALALSGYALNYTGFDVALGGAQSDHTLFLMRLIDVSVPALASVIAIFLRCPPPTLGGQNPGCARRSRRVKCASFSSSWRTLPEPWLQLASRRKGPLAELRLGLDAPEPAD